MAEALPGFSQEDSDFLRESFASGQLTEADKDWIIQQVDRASKAVEGDVSALGPTEEPQKPFAQRALNALNTRETAAALGGTAGTILGTATMPVTGVAGPIAGGALGAAAGSNLFDNFTNLKNHLTGSEDPVIGMEQTTRNALGEGLTDAAFSMGGALAQPVRLGRMVISRLSGLNEKASRELMMIAEEAGIRLGAVDVGGTFPKGWAKTIGVFPFSGTPMREAEIQKLGDVNKAVNNILDTFAPNEKLTSEIGLDMYEAAKNSRQEFRNVSAEMYNGLKNLISDSKNPRIIPTVFTDEEGAVKGLKVFAIEQNDAARRGAILLNDGTLLPRKQSDELAGFFEKLALLPDLINPTQFERLSDDLKYLIEKNLSDGYDIKVLSQAKKALRDGFDNLRTDILPPGEAQSIKESAERVNDFYSKGIVKYQTVVAKTFERVNKFIFRAGADEAGSLNADEIYHAAINLRSPQQIKDLVSLVGRGNVANAAQRHFDIATEAARTEVKILGKSFYALDPNVLERKLGLVGAGSKNLEGVEELYKMGGVKIEDIKTLIGVMKKIEGIGDPAEFVRRRIVLGGVAGAAGVLGIGGAVAGGSALAGGDGGEAAAHGIITATALTLFGRWGSRILSDPDKLKLLTGALDESRAAIPRRANLARLTNLLGNNEPEIPQTRIDNEM